MLFVDEITIRASGGRGGDGVVRWLHEKGKEFGGPSGGDGGAGGDVLFRAVQDLNILGRYRGRSVFKAEHGENGKGKNMAGKNGESITIDVPVGSVVTNLDTESSFELIKEGEVVVALNGGVGGLGNTHFKSSIHQNPFEFTKGKAGERATFKIELKLIADVGIVGLPNAGKSSLLNALTNAEAKVGSYAFTTLDPNLGVFDGLILADIPGLIEGASGGKGLGHKFLRHISRTKTLLHCVSSENEDPKAAYDTVRAELKAFDPELLKKPEIVLLTKSDMVDDNTKAKRLKKLSEVSKNVFAVSILDDNLIQKMKEMLS